MPVTLTDAEVRLLAVAIRGRLRGDLLDIPTLEGHARRLGLPMSTAHDLEAKVPRPPEKDQAPPDRIPYDPGY